jgi:dTDP-4-amino-4,6-dideoxygalactose transaminase
MTAAETKLAIEGGPAAVRDPLPRFLESAGRTLGAEEEALVIEALRSGCLSRNGGTMVKRFEREFGARLGVEHAIACSSGSAAIHLAIAALDPEPSDEFIVPPITDIGSVAPILWQNCVPVFADVDARTMTIDPADVARKITTRTRGIIAVHLAGQPCAMSELKALAGQHGVALIEDCAQAYGAEYGGRVVGSIGDMACFSLQQSKHITCGEGGVMITSDAALARRAALFSDKAWPREAGGLGSARFLFLAQNYRLSELQGAVALGQLGKLGGVVGCRRARAAQLTRLICGIPGVAVPDVPDGTRHAWWLYMLQVDEQRLGVCTQKFGEALVAEGVHAWVRYIVEPIYTSPVFSERRTYGRSGYPFNERGGQNFAKGLCPNAELALSRTVAIHWNENYTESQVEQIAAAILKVVRHFHG